MDRIHIDYLGLPQCIVNDYPWEEMAIILLDRQVHRRLMQRILIVLFLVINCLLQLLFVQLQLLILTKSVQVGAKELLIRHLVLVDLHLITYKHFKIKSLKNIGANILQLNRTFLDIINNTWLHNGIIHLSITFTPISERLRLLLLLQFSLLILW
jgi:hypothetical protein